MSRKTEFASSWWAQRWIRLLERFGWSARLNRGRSYARHGNVLDIDVQPGLVRAKVQGSRKQPYRVEIGLKPLDRADWNKIFAILRRKAIYAARLLSGEMPRDIEEIFKAAQVPLFPQRPEDLIMSCTCPDWANPCKHVAAVYYVLGSEFDRDPFLLFELRGRSKEQLMASLRGTRPERLPKANVPRVSSEPLEQHLNDYWDAGDELDTITIRVTPPPVPQAILKRLGPMPLVDLPEEWLGDLSAMYETVGKDALAFVHVSGKGPMRVPRMGPDLSGANGASEEPDPEYTEASDSADDEAAVELQNGTAAITPGAVTADSERNPAIAVEVETPDPAPAQRGSRGRGQSRRSRQPRVASVISAPEPEPQNGTSNDQPAQLVSVGTELVAPTVANDTDNRDTAPPPANDSHEPASAPFPDDAPPTEHAKPKRSRLPRKTASVAEVGPVLASESLESNGAAPGVSMPSPRRRTRAAPKTEPNPA